MLTKKQVEDLKPGTYTNMKLMEMFPKQQGKGKSSYFLDFGKDERTGWYIKGKQI